MKGGKLYDFILVNLLKRGIVAKRDDIEEVFRLEGRYIEGYSQNALEDMVEHIHNNRPWLSKEHIRETLEESSTFWDEIYG